MASEAFQSSLEPPTPGQYTEKDYPSWALTLIVTVSGPYPAEESMSNLIPFVIIPASRYST